jgi:hypothetical protein
MPRLDDLALDVIQQTLGFLGRLLPFLPKG